MRIGVTESYPNDWGKEPSRDGRYDALLDVAAAICDLCDYVDGKLDSPEAVPAPLEIAQLLRETAERIEAVTRGEDS